MVAGETGRRRQLTQLAQTRLNIVADERLGEPSTNRELFERLATAGWIDSDLAMRAANMAGFRNVLVHGYTEVDLAILEDVLVNHLQDLDRFVAAVRARMTTD